MKKVIILCRTCSSFAGEMPKKLYTGKQIGFCYECYRKLLIARRAVKEMQNEKKTLNDAEAAERVVQRGIDAEGDHPGGG